MRGWSPRSTRTVKWKDRKYLNDLIERRRIALRDFIIAEQRLSSAVAERTPVTTVIDSFRQMEISNTLNGRNAGNEQAWRIVPTRVLSLLENVRVGDHLAAPNIRVETTLKHIREVIARMRESKPAL